MRSERDAYIALNMIRELGPVTVRVLSESLGSVAALFTADARRLLAVSGASPEPVRRLLDSRRRVDPGAEVERARRLGVRLVTPVDPDYPDPLRRLYDPPLALYLRGTLEPDDRRAVAIVGSRHTTGYGREIASAFAWQLARDGWTIVSGLARGIDTRAHQGALQADGGRTLAVLGGGLHDLYPPENRELAESITAHGALVTEFPLGREPDRTTFPIRNRIVSGLAQAVLVVEAGQGSGAMITAHVAADQGKPVFVVPGRVDGPTFQGSHQLIKSGAHLVDSVADILDELGSLFHAATRPSGPPARPSDPPPKPQAPLSEPESAILQRLMDEERMDLDALTRQSGLPASTVTATLLMLEMKRLVRALPGRRVEIVR